MPPDPTAARSCSITESQNRCASCSPRSTETHAVRSPRFACSSHEPSNTVFPLPAGADTSVTPWRSPADSWSNNPFRATSEGALKIAVSPPSNAVVVVIWPSSFRGAYAEGTVDSIERRPTARRCPDELQARSRRCAPVLACWLAAVSPLPLFSRSDDQILGLRGLPHRVCHRYSFDPASHQRNAERMRAATACVCAGSVHLSLARAPVQANTG